MSDFLFQYHSIQPTTWVYLSSLLMIGLFFKFGRLWSVRNLDLMMLILLGPGLLMVHYGQAKQGEIENTLSGLDVGSQAANEETGDVSNMADTAVLPDKTDNPDAAEPAANAATPVPTPAATKPPLAAGDALSESESGEGADKRLADAQKLEVWGFVFLLGVSALLLVRLLLDPVMVRRPLLEPNLSQGGLFFIAVALFIFLMADVIAEPDSPYDPETGDYRIAQVTTPTTSGPGYALLSVLPKGLTKTLAILGQLLVIVGLVLVGYWHFRNLVMGVGAAAMYLMLPYSTLLTGRIEHILPAAALVWAVLMYRRPLMSGALIGLASGFVYYPFFLLPLWLSFYWHKGFKRFLTSYLLTLAVLVLGLLIYSPNGLTTDLHRMFGGFKPAMDNLGGIWNPDAGGFDPNYRVPVLVAFIALSISLALWPAQKNLGTLLSCTAVMMVAAQFWHGYGGGTYMAWYLPLFLLTIFRPNLEDRVAVSVLADSWFPRKNKLKKAAQTQP